MLLQAIRSGVINAEDSYRFEVPSSYREVGVANIQSGNFCMVLLHYHPAHASSCCHSGNTHVFGAAKLC